MSSLSRDARRALLGWFVDEPSDLRPLGEGHINSTWRVELPVACGEGRQRYVLQRMSQAVFAEPALVMANLSALFGDSGAIESKPLKYVLPQPIPARSGELLVNSGQETLPSGDVVESVWRLMPYVEDSQTLQSLATAEQARAAGRAFGEFQHWLTGLADAPLAEVIPGFHQLDGYVSALGNVVVDIETVGSPLVDREQFLVRQLQQRPYAPALAGGAHGVIHGDCKVNNLLFTSDAQRVIAIVDLDTLMRAPWWLDFGDLVRSATCTERGEFQRDFYPSLVAGFFVGRSGTEHAERSSDLVLDDALQAPAYMTYMLCVRFLTDHLRGDRYFNVTFRGENLARAEQQFRLLEALESEATKTYMREILQPYFH